MNNHGIDNNDPFFKYTLGEIKNMSDDEFFDLLEAHNTYVQRKHELLKESKPPKFNTIEEVRAYYHCRPLDEVINNIDNLVQIK